MESNFKNDIRVDQIVYAGFSVTCYEKTWTNFLANSIQMNLFTKQKQTYRYWKQNYSYQRGNVRRRDKPGAWEWTHTYTTVYKIQYIRQPKGPTVYHDICMKKESKKEWVYVYIHIYVYTHTHTHIYESLCCTAETNTTV